MTTYTAQQIADILFQCPNRITRYTYDDETLKLLEQERSLSHVFRERTVTMPQDTFHNGLVEMYKILKFNADTIIEYSNMWRDLAKLIFAEMSKNKTTFNMYYSQHFCMDFVILNDDGRFMVTDSFKNEFRDRFIKLLEEKARLNPYLLTTLDVSDNLCLSGAGLSYLHVKHVPDYYMINNN